MAREYGTLPSKLIDHATTLDYLIFDRAWDFRRRQELKNSGQRPAPEVSQDRLIAMMAEVKQRGPNKSRSTPTKTQ
jgi:hypothetical protein